MYLFLIIPLIAIITVVLIIWISKHKAKVQQKEIIDKLNIEKQQREERARELLLRQTEKRNKQLCQFRQLFFAISTVDKDVSSEWSKWPSALHDTDDQLDNQCKALYWTKPVLIDISSRHGIFYEAFPETVVETTLTSCTCKKFAESGKPCPHIYRLFHEVSDQSHKIPEIKNIDSSLIERFNSVDFSLQSNLIRFIATIPEKGKDMPVSDVISAGVEAGLLITTDTVDYKPLLEKMTKDEILLALTKHGVKGFASSWTKTKLVAWVMDTQQEFLKYKFKNIAHVSIVPSATDWAQGVEKSLFIQSAVIPINWRDATEKFPPVINT